MDDESSISTFISRMLVRRREDLLTQLLILGIVYLVVKLCSFYYRRWSRYKEYDKCGIPGPKPELLSGNWKMLGKIMIDGESHKWLAKEFGPVNRVFLGDQPAIMISDLDIIEKVFFDQVSSFKGRTKLILSTPLDSSIFFTSHDRWRAIRRIMAQPFTSYTMRGEESTHFIEESVGPMIQYLERKFTDNKTGARINIDMHDLMKATALHLISSMAVKLPDVEVRENDPNVISLDWFLSRVDNGLMQLEIRFPFLMPICSFIANNFEHNHTLRVIRQGLNQVIDEHLKSRAGCDSSQAHKSLIIDSLVKMHLEGKLTRTEVISNAQGLLVAGYDTTSTTLTYIFWALGKYTEIQERLRAELKAHGSESKYLEQVIFETMRLYPTLPQFIMRRATETVVVGEWTIPEGTTVCYTPWVVHRDPKHWTEPEKFNPDRFRNGLPTNPCVFAPFGLGNRKCLGMKLAMIEMQTIICELLLKYKLILKSPQNLALKPYAIVLSKPVEKVVIELERL